MRIRRERRRSPDGEAELHELIGRIYDGAVGGQQPMAILESAARLTQSSVAMWDVADLSSGIVTCPIFNTDADLRRKASEYAPFNLCSRLFNRDSATSGHAVASLDEWRDNSTYHDILRPGRTVHLLHLNYWLDAHFGAGISLWRDIDEEPHGPNELWLGDTLARHLRRAYEVGRRLNDPLAKSGHVDFMHDALAAACFVIDATGRLLHANTQAESVLRCGGVLRQRHGRVEAVGDQGTQWRRLLGALAPPSGAPSGTVIALDGSTGPTVLRAVPLRPARAEPWGVPLSMAALGLVLIEEAKSDAPSLKRVLASAFKLTPADVSLAMALLHDESLGDYAARTNRSLNTVRTHLKSLFAKTDTHRQAALVRRLSVAGRHLACADPPHPNG